MINKGKPKVVPDPALEAKRKNKPFQINGVSLSLCSLTPTFFLKSINDGVDVQLFCSATKLANLDYLTVSDPQCTLKVKEANNAYAVQKIVGETEVIDNNLNPVWTKHFAVVYQFNRDRELLFQVWNFNDKTSRDLIGEAECRLTDIMMAPSQCITMKLTIKSKPGVARGYLKVFSDSVK